MTQQMLMPSRRRVCQRSGSHKGRGYVGTTRYRPLLSWLFAVSGCQSFFQQMCRVLPPRSAISNPVGLLFED